MGCGRGEIDRRSVGPKPGPQLYLLLSQAITARDGAGTNLPLGRASLQAFSVGSNGKPAHGIQAGSSAPGPCSPGTLLALLTLALGIGANSAIFTVVNAVLLRPLPFAEADQLVGVYRVRTPASQSRLSAPCSSASAIATACSKTSRCSRPAEPTLTGNGDPQRVTGLNVSDGFFETFRVRPLSAATFTKPDNETGAARIVVLSEELWRTRFGGDREIVGKPIMLNGRSTIVVGVTPAQFGKAVDAALFTPMSYNEDFRDISNFYAHYLSASRGSSRASPSKRPTATSSAPTRR